jgi:HlyD family secretion protein
VKKRIIRLLLLVVVAAVAVTVWLRVRQGEPEDRVQLSGNIELTQVDIAFKVPGKLVERTVREGDWVKQGQLIARIDDVQTQRMRAAQAAGVETAQAQLAQTSTGMAWQKATLEGDIDLRRAEVRQAQAHLDQLLAGARPQEIQQAEAAAADARTAHEQARRDWERAQTLYQNDDISTAQRDQAQSRFNSTAAVVQQAEQRLALVREGPRKEEIAAARAQLSRAQAALRISEANSLETKRREQELTARRSEVERARAQLGVTESQLQDTAVYSPIDGTVLVKSAEVGEVLAAGTTVVTIGDLNRPWVRGYIKATDLGRVKLGQRVRITTDSFPGKEYWGTISFIASEAEFTPKQIQTKDERVKLMYRVKVDVENPLQELKANMPVDAEILLGS